MTSETAAQSQGASSEATPAGGGDRAALEGQLTIEDLERVTGGDGSGSMPWYVQDSAWLGGPEENPFNYTGYTFDGTYMGPGWGSANYDASEDPWGRQ